MARRILLGLLPILFLGLAYGAYTLAQYGWDQVVEYQSPFAGELLLGERRNALTKRLVIVVVDGLRLDASREMTNLNRLRARGTDLVAITGQPSLSFPGWTVIGSGALQEVSGVTTNWYEGTVPVGSIFAASQGQPNALVGTEGWEMLFGPWIDQPDIVRGELEWGDLEGAWVADEEILNRGLVVLDGAAGLLLIYFPAVDEAGHWFGGESPQYIETVQRVDEHIGKIVAALDLETTTLIVTTDHGMTAAGGHGGWEEQVIRTPLVMVGPGIKEEGDGGEVSQADISPTVAVLLGLPIPTHSQGLPLIDYLKGDEELLSQRTVDAAEQQLNFWTHYANRLGSDLTSAEGLEEAQAALEAGKFGWATEVSRQFISDVRRMATEVREARLTSERLGRLPIALAVAILPLLYLAGYPKKRELLLPLALAVLYFVVHYSLFFGRGLSWSLSAFGHESQILAFIYSRLIEAAVLSLLAGILVGVLKRRESVGEAWAAAVHTSFFVAYGLILQIDLFYLLWDVSFTWYLPDLLMGFKYYLDLFQLVGVAGTAILLPFLGLGARWVAARVPIGR